MSGSSSRAAVSSPAVATNTTPTELRIADVRSSTEPQKPSSDRSNSGSDNNKQPVSKPASTPGQREVKVANQPEQKPVQSSVHSGEGFRVYLQGSAPIAVGQTKPFTVVIEPQKPFKSNDKYPYRFAGLKAQGVSLANDAVTNANITPERTTLQVNVTGTAAGAASLEGTLSFSVCTEEKCLVERTTLKVAFEVI